jgi:hypothetical protein
MVATRDYPQLPATISRFPQAFENKRTPTNVEMQQSTLFGSLKNNFRLVRQFFWWSSRKGKEGESLHQPKKWF